MAKGTPLGLWTGKKGSSVFYLIANSNNNQRQGIREYQAKIGNPRTVAQVAQRLKLNPARNFYMALRDEVLNHSFQGVPYGGRSNLTFMRYAMRADFEGFFPFVPANYPYPVPGNYVLSRGSLPPIVVNALALYLDVTDCYMSGVNFNDEYNRDYYDWLSIVLQENSLLQLGDQLTFVAVSYDYTTGEFTPHVRRLVLDPSRYSASMSAYQVFAKEGVFVVDNYFNIGRPNSPSWQYDSLNIVAAAVIVSRPEPIGLNKRIKWYRSNSTLYVDVNLIPAYFLQSTYEAVVDSYRGAPTTIDIQYYLNANSPGRPLSYKYPNVFASGFTTGRRNVPASTLFAPVEDFQQNVDVTVVQSFANAKDSYLIQVVYDPNLGRNVRAIVWAFYVENGVLHARPSAEYLVIGCSIQPNVSAISIQELDAYVQKYGIVYRDVYYRTIIYS